MSHEVPDPDADRRHRHTAGAFDIRNVIGALLGIYGVVLTVLGVVADDTGQRTGDLDANLWAGLGLLAVAACFLLWARLRPLVVEEPAPTGSADGEQAVGEDR